MRTQSTDYHGCVNYPAMVRTERRGEGCVNVKEIRFRAWDKNNKGFINGFNMIGFSTGQGAPFERLARFSDKWNEEDFELMQFAGIRDKHGMPVFEGDIVTAWSQGSQGRFQVKWREDGGGTPCWLLYPAWKHGQSWRLSATREEDGLIYDRGIEVIGNIYENGDLLNE